MIRSVRKRPKRIRATTRASKRDGDLHRDVEIARSMVVDIECLQVSRPKNAKTPPAARPKGECNEALMPKVLRSFIAGHRIPAQARIVCQVVSMSSAQYDL
jgi:hypothetical protein